jgi:hypothetical protein
MHALLLTAAFAVVPSWADNTVRDRCDLIELNHYFDEHGRLVFDQVIFLDWSEADSRFQVVAWRLVKHESQIPRPDCCGRKHYTTLWDDNGVMRAVVADSFRETFTQYDVELLEREVLPKAQRRELRPVPSKGRGR